MTANDDLERRIADFYATEAPRAPDRVLRGALDTIDITRQRRAFIRVPWRFSTMNTNARMAIAAVAVVAVGAVGLSVLRPGQSPGVGGPRVTPSPSPSDSQLPSPTASAAPSGFVPGALTETFTSNVHGITVSYPAGWDVQPATSPWTTVGGALLWEDPAGDFLYDPFRTDHLFLELASQPLGDTSFDDWASTLLAAEDCTPSEPVEIDGAVGVIGECDMALVSAGGRGYLIRLYVSSDESDLRSFDSASWFDQVLATVQLTPETATSASSSAAP
jgi:hypothetical protein